MSILDERLHSFDQMYSVVVHRAAEWEEAVIQEFVKLHGHPPLLGHWRHIEVRCISEERSRWGTTRNAIHDREYNQPIPSTPAVEPLPPASAGAIHTVQG